MNSQTDPHSEEAGHVRDDQTPPPKREINERAFEFAVRVIKLCKYLERNGDVSRSLISQLMRASTSIGANLEEAKAGESRADFIHKCAISLKEAREAKYWLRLISSTESLGSSAEKGLAELKKEADELSRIIGKIVVNSRKNAKGR